MSDEVNRAPIELNEKALDLAEDHLDRKYGHMDGWPLGAAGKAIRTYLENLPNKNEHPTPDWDGLIDHLEAELIDRPENYEESGWNEALSLAIAIVRQFVHDTNVVNTREAAVLRGNDTPESAIKDERYKRGYDDGYDTARSEIAAKRGAAARDEGRPDASTARIAGESPAASTKDQPISLQSDADNFTIGGPTPERESDTPTSNPIEALRECPFCSAQPGWQFCNPPKENNYAE